MYLSNEWLYGSVESVASHGNRLYYTEGDILTTLDVTNPLVPIVLKKIERAGVPLYGGSTSGKFLACNNNCIAVCQFAEGLLIVDPHNFSINRIKYTGAVASVHIVGNKLYVAEGKKVHIYDTNNVYNLTELSTLTYSGAGNIGGLFGDGINVGIIVSPSIFIYNEITQLEIFSKTYTAIFILDCILDNYLYIARRDGYIDCINILTNEIISSYYGVGIGTGMKISKTNNYIISGYHDVEVQIIDYTTPSNPIKVSVYDYIVEIGGYPRCLTVFGDYFALASNYRGMSIVDISNITSPVQIFKTDGVARIYSCIMSPDNNYVYVLDDTGGRILDNSGELKQLSYIDVKARAYHTVELDYTKKILYCPFTWGGMKFFDISDPNNISIYFDGNSQQQYVYAVKLVGNLLYALAQYPTDTVSPIRIEVWDISSTPTLISTYMAGLGRMANYFEIYGNELAFGVDSNLVFVNISDIYNMYEITRITGFASQVNNIIYKNYILYVWDRVANLTQVDVVSHTILKSKKIAVIPAGIGEGMEIVGTNAYLGIGAHLVKYDLLTDTIIKDDYVGNSRAIDYVKNTNNYITVAMGASGISIYNLSDTQIYGNVNIISNISGAKVFLDGEDTGHVTPFTLNNLATGKHTIELILSPYLNYKTEIVIKENITANLDCLLYSETPNPCPTPICNITITQII